MDSSDPSCLTRRREGGLVTVVGAVVRVVGAVVRAVGEVVTVVGEVVLGSGEQGVAGESNISRWNSLLQVFAVEVGVSVHTKGAKVMENYIKNT